MVNLTELDKFFIYRFWQKGCWSHETIASLIGGDLPDVCILLEGVAGWGEEKKKIISWLVRKKLREEVSS